MKQPSIKHPSIIRQIKQTLRDPNAYHVLCGLRGPDTDGSYHGTADGNAKEVTTAVVRSLLGVPGGRLMCSVTTPAEAVKFWAGLPESSRDDARAFMANNTHFRTHTSGTFRQLSKLGSRSAKKHLEWLRAERIVTGP